jgi:ketosteroid isomerase-like protein
VAQENLEIVRSVYRAWNADDIDAALPLIHSDVDWQPSGTFPGMQAVYTGHGGVRAFWRALKEPFERFLIHADRLTLRDGWVIAELTFEATGAQSGVGVSLQFVNAFQIRDARIARFVSRRTYEEALEAVGLSE